MNKTYFNFEEKLQSKGLVEAISLANGFGPFCGFGSHQVNSNNLILTPEPSNTDEADKNFYNAMYPTIHGRLVSHRINIQDGSNINFGCVSKDGYIFVSSDSQMTIPIEGSKGVNSDIIVMAIHTPIKEPVENPVSFRAFWSQSATSFYEIYKKSLDINYPQLKDKRNFNTNEISLEYSFDKLESMVKSAIGSLITWDNTKMNLIGIYGVGNDMMNQGAQENYRIIPYDSQFPLNTFNTTKESQIKENLEVLKKSIGTLPEAYENLVSYIEALFKSKVETPTAQVNQALPKGSIILWYGSQSNIPYGWELCDGGTSVNDPGFSKPNLMGKVVVGLSTGTAYNTPGATGGRETVTLNENNLPSHRHIYAGDSNAKGKFSIDGKLYPEEPAPYKQSSDSSASGSGNGATYYTTPVGKNSPFSIMPPYCVVAYIIKTI